MSDLEQIRRHAHDNIERLAAASAIIELDANAMRAAIIDVLRVYDTDREDDCVTDTTAQRMAWRLRQLSRVSAEARADAAVVEVPEPEPLTGYRESYAQGVLDGWKADPTSSVFGGLSIERDRSDDRD